MLLYVFWANSLHQKDPFIQYLVLTVQSGILKHLGVFENCKIAVHDIGAKQCKYLFLWQCHQSFYIFRPFTIMNTKVRRVVMQEADNLK